MFESDGRWTTPEPARPVEPDSVDLAELAVVPIDAVEARVCALAGHLASATCRWLLLLGEYDSRTGWAGPGLRSCAQWLSWRCGLSMPAARQHVRVARALRSLPRVRSEFAAGRLSYSKVRSITRIATPELEDSLVDLALTLTAAALDQVVAGYRRTAALNDRPSGRPARSTNWHWDDDGSLVVRLRLAPEEGALWLAAVEAMQHQLDSSGVKNDPAGSPDPSDDLCGADDTAAAYKCSRTDAVVAMAATALATGPIDASGSDRYEVVIHADLDQILGTTDKHNHDDHVHHDHGHQQPTNVTADSSDHSHDNQDKGACADDITCEACAREQPLPARALVRGRCHLRDGPCVHPATVHRLACDAALRLIIHGPDGSPKDSGRRIRLAKGDLRRRLEERDQRRCQFPGCHHTKFLQAHHIVHWAHGGRTDLDNLILLCSHHHRLLHEHGYTINIVSPGRFTFHRPDGTHIDRAPALAGAPGLHMLPTDLHSAPPITEHTTTPTWGGEPLDLGYVVSLLFPPDQALAS